MNKKKITPALLSGMMTISMGTTPISVLAQEEQPQEINETSDEVKNEPTTTEENEVIVNNSNDSQNDSTEQQNESEESSEGNTENTEIIVPISNTVLRAGSTEQTESSVAKMEMNGTVTYHDTLNEAVHAISDVQGTGTITLLQNASLTGWSAIGIEGNITLNGNNYKISGDNNGISVYGTLTIKNCDFSNYASLYSYKGGTINIYGGVFGNVRADGGVVNIYEGSFDMVYDSSGGIVHYIPKSITIQERTVLMKIDSTYQLVADVELPVIVGGNDYKIIPSWSSSDDSIVSVDAQGNLTANGIGEATITATAGDKSATCTVTVTKKTQDAPNLDSLAATYIDNDSITLDCAKIASFENLQYAYAEGDNVTAPTSDDEWKDVTKDTSYRINLTNLKEATPYTIFLRYKETSDSAASQPSSKVFTTMYSSAGAKLDYENETITVREANSNYEVDLQNVDVGTVTSDETRAIPIDDTWFGNTIIIRLIDAPGSVAQEVNIPARPAAPSSLKGEVTGSGVNDCKITGLEDNVSYEISSDKGQTWNVATVENGAITGLSLGTYRVRVKAVEGSSFASLPATVTIVKANSSIAFTEGFNLDKTYDTNAVVVTENNVTITGSQGNASFLYEKKVDGNWKPLSKAPTNAGTYRVTAYLEGDTNYNAAQSEPLEFTISKAETSLEIISDLTQSYNGQPVSNPEVNTTGSNKEVTFTWYGKDGENWKEISSTPTDAGSYKVIASVEADENYNSANAVKEFSISQTKNEWTEELFITGWKYGEKAGTPTVKAKFGEVTYSYSSKEDGTYIEEVPTDAGTWYVKATVTGNENYTGLEAIQEFTISKADSSIAFKDGFKLDKTYDTKAVIVTADAVETAGSKGNISYTYEEKDGDTWNVLEEAPTGAGTYRVSATLDGDNNYNSATSESLEFTIDKADTVLEFTVDDLDKVYDGEAINAPTRQSGNSHVRVLTWYQLDEDRTWTKLEKAPVNAGSYKVVASVEPDDNYNGTEIEMTFEITKAVPSYTIPENLIIRQGDALSTVSLPEGFTWKDATQKAESLGTQTFKAIFTPEDTTNYQTVEVDVTVKVVPVPSVINQLPKINAEDKTLTVGDEYDPMDGVTATDKEDGDLTDKVEVMENNVDASKVGTYEVTYKVTDSQGAFCIKTITVTVNPKTEVINAAPIINAENKTLTVGDTFDPMEGVSATDKEDGDLTDSIQITKNTVDTSKAGRYTVVYEVKDSGGIRVVKTIFVTVEEKKAETGKDENDSNQKNPSKDTAQTGTQTNLLTWSVLTLGSLGALVTVFRRKQR